jgi:hypothetical protein
VDLVVFVGRFGEIDLDQCIWHCKLPFLQALGPINSLSVIFSENRYTLFRITL